MRFMRLIGAFAAVMLVTACASSDDDAAEPEVMSTESGSGASGSSTSASDLTVQEQLERIGDRVFFGYDRADLTPQARQTVESWAGWLRANPAVVVVLEGHADERGTREYNLALGERRASSAKNYLAALGINPNRVRTISYGKERPAVVGSNEAAWSQNRRAVMVVQ